MEVIKGKWLIYLWDECYESGIEWAVYPAILSGFLYYFENVFSDQFEEAQVEFYIPPIWSGILSF
jgi:hypothetical protein